MSCFHTARAEDEIQCPRCCGYDAAKKSCPDCGGCGAVPRMVRCECDDGRCYGGFMSDGSPSCGCCEPGDRPGMGGHGCGDCGGTGKVPAAEAVIELRSYTGSFGQQRYAAWVGETVCAEDTHDEALAAARKALSRE